MSNQVIRMPRESMGGQPEGTAGVWLQPIAAPSILGLFGFSAATFMVAAHIAHWYGNANTGLYLAPFAATFGGLAQFLAGMWAFKARDGLATAMHGMWGSFWMAYGILNILFVSGHLAPPAGAQFQGLGFWFIGLAAITWSGTVAAKAESTALTLVLGFLAAGSTLYAIGQIAGLESVSIAGGWTFVVSAIIAWYTATGLMLEGSLGRSVLPMGKTEHAKQAPEFNSGFGEPGVRHGQ